MNSLNINLSDSELDDLAFLLFLSSQPMAKFFAGLSPLISKIDTKVVVLPDISKLNFFHTQFNFKFQDRFYSSYKCFFLLL